MKIKKNKKMNNLIIPSNLKIILNIKKKIIKNPNGMLFWKNNMASKQKREILSQFLIWKLRRKLKKIEKIKNIKNAVKIIY